MKRSTNRIYMLLICLFMASPSIADRDTLVRLQSPYSVSETIDRLEDALAKKSMTVFQRIDHAAGARKAGLELRDTELLIFGNPKVGTKLMHCAQEVAIDLPMKMLSYKDGGGRIWLAYTKVDELTSRHGIEDCAEVANKIGGALAKFAEATISKTYD